MPTSAKASRKTICGAYDALKHSDIHHILVRHEQGATHMADGYARASGRVGVAVATSGPGATNMVTGIATAMMDSSPIVCITGQVGSKLIGSDAFQETDITGITLPITKHNYLVTTAEDVAPAVRDAIELITAAERPLILAGHGVMLSGAERQIIELAERAQIPIAVTLLGLGGVPASHPLNLGMMGMHGEAWVNNAIQEADLLIALGMRFDDRVTGNLKTYAPTAKKIHVEIDASEIGKNVKVDVALVSDLRAALVALTPRVPALRHDDWLAEIGAGRQETHSRDIIHQPDGGRLLA